jgi:hypothetical protein
VFSVSKKQLRILAESSVAAYLDRVTVRICADFPAELGALPGGELRSRVQASFNRFRVRGFQRKEYLHRLIVLELLFGPQFEAKLPEDVRLFAFPESGMSYPPEAERFWAIYRAADHLTAKASSTDMRAKSEVWR